MGLEVGIRLDLQQKLVMTPELRQAIAILQLPVLELSGMIERELVENPVLEIDEVESPSEESVPVQPEWTAALIDYLGEYEPYEDTGTFREKVSPERYLSESLSLADHLEFQLNLLSLSPLVHTAGVYMIRCLDERGYLTQKIEEIGKTLEISREMAEEVLSLVQGLDPAGIAARNLQECLTLQLYRLGITDPLILQLAEEHLAAIAAGNFKVLAAELNCTVEDIHRAVDVIRTLNPKPGLGFSAHRNENGYVVADVTVKRIEGEYVILLESNMPRLMINRQYRQLLSAGDADTKKYIQSRIHSATWLIRGIEQRNDTLYRVTEAIVRRQKGFFDRGPRHIRPLTLRQIAEDLGMHESTISRAAANKYMDTPYGLFSMKTFFSAGLPSSAGMLSTTEVKRRIRAMVEAEPRHAPLSDQRIADLLQAEGIEVARRTVAKYREELRIASAKLRKRQ